MMSPLASAIIMISMTTDRSARLYLNGQDVGAVSVRGANTSWRFGDFAPNARFTDFAPLFATWSLMMHVDGETSRLSRDASQELRRAEYAIDALEAQLYFPDKNEWRRLAQINIDGPLVEWKEY